MADAPSEDPIASLKKDLRKKGEDIDNYIKTIEQDHSRIHNLAIEDTIGKKDDKGKFTGDYDWNKLDTPDGQKNLEDKLIDGYLNISKKYFKDEIIKDPKMQNQILNYLTGSTRAMLKKRIGEHGANYTAGIHGKYAQKHIEQVKDLVQPTIIENIKYDVHGKALTKYFGIDKPNEDLIRGNWDTLKSQFYQLLMNDNSEALDEIKKHYKKKE